MIETHTPPNTNISPETHSNQSLIQAYALSRVFQQEGQAIVAVSNITCSIRPGDRIAITGPSGSGKSTLLHLFGGLDRPTSGSITWPAFGDPDNLRPTHIGVALQMPGLLPPLTVAENVSIPLLLSNLDPGTARDIALQTLEMLDLLSLADQLPEELSGGQAQRVALARALVTRPALILADEPTGQLDHPTAQRLFDLMFSICTDQRISLVVATHDQAVVERFDQVWKIRQGKLEGAQVNE